MITDRIFFAESLMIPSSYQTIFKKINSNLLSNNYAVFCNTFKDKLEDNFKSDAPQIKNYSEYTKADYLRNVIFLKQAYNFGNLAQTAIPEVKPLLLYYAENQLQAFFTYSLFHFEENSIGHGLSVSGKSYQNIGVKIQKNGFFQRLVNSYSILGSNWIHCPLEFNSFEKAFKKFDGEFIYSKKPTIKLKKLIEIKNISKPNPDGYILDQSDYIFLFIASSLTRYQPDLWHSIVGGEEGNEFVYFKQSFTRFWVVWDRLINVLYSIYHNSFPPPLYYDDEEMKDLKYKIY